MKGKKSFKKNKTKIFSDSSDKDVEYFANILIADDIASNLMAMEF